MLIGRVSGIGMWSGVKRIEREQENLVESARREEANGASRTRSRRGRDENETRRDENETRRDETRRDEKREGERRKLD